MTTVTAHALGLDSYRPELIDGAVLPTDVVLAACDDLLGRSRAQRAELGFMHPGRVDVIGAGALVWHDVVARIRDEVAAAGGALEAVVTSEHDILDGIAFSAAERLRSESTRSESTRSESTRSESTRSESTRSESTGS